MAKFEHLKDNSDIQDVIIKVNKHSTILNEIEENNLNVADFIKLHNIKEETDRKKQTDEIKDFIRDENKKQNSKIYTRLEKVENKVLELEQSEGKEAKRLVDKIKYKVEDKLIEIIMIALVAYLVLKTQ